MTLIESSKSEMIPEVESHFPFAVQNESYSYYQSIAGKAINLEKPEEVEDFFKDEKTHNLQEVIIKAPCLPEIIALIRNRAIDLLPNNIFSNDEIQDLKSLAGEIISDTRHSMDEGQGFKDPHFIIRISGIGCRDLFSFEVVNQDKTDFSKWKIVDQATDIVEQYGQLTGGTHVGTNMKKEIVKELEGCAEYVAVDGENGEKSYTSFKFEMDGKLRLGSFYNWLKPQEKLEDDPIDQLTELYCNFLKSIGTDLKEITQKSAEVQKLLEDPSSNIYRWLELRILKITTEDDIQLTNLGPSWQERVNAPWRRSPKLQPQSREKKSKTFQVRRFR
ncbi:hypothetical protein A3F08_00010 [Candidatus Berkelbacteria bacterium RIFCSPHIGHO2_12_FULL_36_9]|uniref:Uncharacterized protein n=1 Tax=Candidatus Berkelbacteria bacterium RIFCSPHIGHO2_12_FULL_36_9 TaxID=1797469 RepID=A0A1F5EER5_9BACT|nr:MAG: hypothetical protein A3F08_00010 [Candidatus Berkelbacteria bacterium RIFCSPHIGHO2_12_FULL_36_9]